MIRIRAACLLLFGLLCSPLAADPLEILYETRRPYVIPDNAGLSGLVGAPLTRALHQAGLEVTYTQAPSKRILHQIQANPRPLCSPGWFRTPERDAFAKFSRLIYQDKPMAIVSRPDTAAITDGLSLEALLGHPELVLLAKTAYSYGQVIDAQLERHGTRQRRVGADHVTMLSMIARQRADFLFIGPEEAADLLREHPDRAALRLTHLSGMPEGNRRYLMCSQQVNDAVMQRIDQHLK